MTQNHPLDCPKTQKKEPVRELLRALGIGPRLLRLRRAYDFGLKVELSTYWAKQRYLRAVNLLQPMGSGDGPIDCFMLLNEARIWEGIWSLYSFRVYFGPCHLVVLNDGTLTPDSLRLLKLIFPGIDIPDFEANDIGTAAYLSQLGLQRCRKWRERFVFFRKLIDPFRLTRSGGVILLDSDCLHFRPPEEVQAWAKAPDKVRFIADPHPHSFCATPAELSRICGVAPPNYFCAGYLCVPAAALDFSRIEHYLSDDCFERQLAADRFAHVAEQTLYAMEAAVIGAAILPADYATCPDIPTFRATMGHFCGGSYQRTWLYTKGLPLVIEQLGGKGN